MFLCLMVTLTGCTSIEPVVCEPEKIPGAWLQQHDLQFFKKAKNFGDVIDEVIPKAITELKKANKDKARISKSQE